MTTNTTINRGGALPPVHYDIQSKTLSRETKADATQTGGGPDPALVQWYQQAYAYYQSVSSGQEAQPDPASWQNFLSQMQWAAGQLGLGQGQQAWDPSSGQGAMPGGAGGMPGAQQVPQGASLGTQNNVVYNSPSATINAEGDTRVQDVWSNDVN